MIFLALLTALGLGLSSVFSALPLILNGEGSTSFVPLGCAEFGPFGTLSTCFILCSNSICSNAFDICMERMFPECDAIIRYDAHLDYVSPLTSQLVQLVSLNASIDAVKAINYEKCFDLGKRLSRSPFVQSVTQWDEERKRAYDRYTKKLTAILYLHFRKNGGTTMCRLAQLNGLRVPPVEGHLSLFESSMGKNCNPATFQMKAWFGSKKEQLQYIKSFGIQFFGSEVHLPRPSDIPFGDIVLATTLRHPISRLFSLYITNSNPKYIDKLEIRRRNFSAIMSRYEQFQELYSASGNVLVNQSVDMNSRRVLMKTTGVKVFDKSKFPTFDELLKMRSKILIRKNNTSVPPHLGFPTYLLKQNPSLDVGYFASMKLEPPGNNRLCYSKTRDLSVLDKDILNLEKELKYEAYMKKKNVTLKVKRRTRNNCPTCCNMTLFHLRRNYDASDLELAISIINRFSMVSIFEGMDRLTPLFLRKILDWSETDVIEHRAGTRGNSSIFAIIAPYPKTIAIATQVADLSLDLYLHATRLACLKYFQLSSESHSNETVNFTKSSSVLMQSNTTSSMNISLSYIIPDNSTWSISEILPHQNGFDYHIYIFIIVSIFSMTLYIFFYGRGSKVHSH